MSHSKEPSPSRSPVKDRLTSARVTFEPPSASRNSFSSQLSISNVDLSVAILTSSYDQPQNRYPIIRDNNVMDHRLSTTEGAVLGLIAFGERSGYELSRLAANSVEHLWTPSQSQIYKTLPRLVSRGLARTRRIEQRDRPDKSL